MSGNNHSAQENLIEAIALREEPLAIFYVSDAPRLIVLCPRSARPGKDRTCYEGEPRAVLPCTEKGLKDAKFLVTARDMHQSILDAASTLCDIAEQEDTPEVTFGLLMDLVRVLLSAATLPESVAVLRGTEEA